ncbi:MAG TPA: nucleoside triphosphate pyrophosphohydrolase [Ferruginibacter sp.]|nr:nucleoside triphosphate pyrophosphohydrolase [Ferruginibacter sp.]HRO18006.1 nucleoside triphosphate pyrophosphohydrolase [Ferruginibacter sp.]HRQ21420.1 nucleoside triphosphate pyrophosphohydrolase [Ferruginibacter sp.]
MQTNDAFLRLVKIMDELRAQCPWDKKQTIESLRHLTIEETYELADAITSKDYNGIREELGDLLLHIVFYAKIGSEQQKFTLDEVIHGVCDKLIKRHPHIYGDVQVADEEEVKQNWEKIKLAEGKKSVLGGVPQSLPALVKAIRLQEKSKQVGFEWSNTEQVWDKLHEELDELKDAIQNGNQDDIESETGDVLFSMINLSRFLQVDAENALEKTNRKFMRRFNNMEAAAVAQHKQLHELSLEEMDALWNQIKHLE